MSGFTASLARLGLIAALAIFAGCASSRSFVPAEHVTGLSPDGQEPAAEYTLVEGGEALGDVKVWSSGAERDGSHTLVRVTFEIENQSSAPLRFDAQGLFLEELPEKGAAPGRARAAALSGDRQVPAGETRTLTATFELPSGIWPSDVPGYRVGWSVVAQKAHFRKTPFVYVRAPRSADPWGPPYGAYGYYYGGLYGPWTMRSRWPRYYYSPYYYPPYLR